MVDFGLIDKFLFTSLYFSIFTHNLISTEIGEDGMQILCSGRGTCDECNQCICELEPVSTRNGTQKVLVFVAWLMIYQFVHESLIPACYGSHCADMVISS